SALFAGLRARGCGGAQGWTATAGTKNSSTASTASFSVRLPLGFSDRVIIALVFRRSPTNHNLFLLCVTLYLFYSRLAQCAVHEVRERLDGRVFRVRPVIFAFIARVQCNLNLLRVCHMQEATLLVTHEGVANKGNPSKFEVDVKKFVCVASRGRAGILTLSNFKIPDYLLIGQICFEKAAPCVS